MESNWVCNHTIDLFNHDYDNHFTASHCLMLQIRQLQWNIPSLVVYVDVVVIVINSVIGW